MLRRSSWCALSWSNTPGPGLREAGRGGPAGAGEAAAWPLPGTCKVSGSPLALRQHVTLNVASEPGRGCSFTSTFQSLHRLVLWPRILCAWTRILEKIFPAWLNQRDTKLPLHREITGDFNQKSLFPSELWLVSFSFSKSKHPSAPCRPQKLTPRLPCLFPSDFAVPFSMRKTSSCYRPVSPVAQEVITLAAGDSASFSG